MSLDRTAARTRWGRPPSLFLLTDAKRGGDVAAAMMRLPRGAGVIFRHYAVPGREAEAKRLRHLARQRGLVFLVAGDPRLAARVKADGFHAPEALISRTIFARGLLPGGLLTVAAHGARGLVSAARAKADLVLLSPVFPTQSHARAKPLGVLRFTALATSSAVPVIALGGINAVTAQRLSAAPIAGIAAIGALMG